jgi:DNA-binding HxlR family transcriptional regulator
MHDVRLSSNLVYGVLITCSIAGMTFIWSNIPMPTSSPTVKKSARRSARSAIVDCPIAQASSLIGDTWIILIVRELLSGPKRFGELQSTVVSAETGRAINTRTLCLRLATLEAANIVIRTEFEHEKPPHVEYSLTQKGEALSKIIEQVKKYGERYL